MEQYGSIAQLGEHLPYKQRVTGSSPVVPTNIWPGSSVGLECQPVTLEVEGSSPFRVAIIFASVAQSVEQQTENLRVGGSIPPRGTLCGSSSVGRAPPCQGGGRESEPRLPLSLYWCHGQVVRQRSAKPLFPSSNLGGTSNKTISFGWSFFFYSATCTLHRKAKKHAAHGGASAVPVV